MRVGVLLGIFVLYKLRYFVDARFESASSANEQRGLAEPLLEDQTEAGECDASAGTCGSIDEPSSDLLQDKADDNEIECVDRGSDCKDLVERSGSLENACIRSFDKMRRECRATCLLCNDLNLELAENVFSEKPQEIKGQQADEVWDFQIKVDDYMYNKVYSDDKFDSVKMECKNRHEQCAYWAFIGECEKNPSCGQVNRMFSRIVSEPEFQQYNPQILSQPEPTSEDILEGPWVVVLDNFLTPHECETLIELGAKRGYVRSQDVGAKKFDGTFDGKQSESRTSTNAWCTEECWENATTQTVHDRMENLIQVPRGNYEYLQLLRYEEGQFYGSHHDYIFHHLDRFPGVRILTVFLYLNTVEEGGGTNFPKLNNMTVDPKQGRVLLWPSVLDSDPNKKDGRTDHQALPPLKGVKYGANAWVHQRDFKEVWKKGCH